MNSITDALLQQAIVDNVRAELQTDVGSGDITAALLPNDLATAHIKTREDAIFCGKPWVEAVFTQLDPQAKLEWYVADGDMITAGQTLLTLTAPARVILTGERSALNLMQCLSGTATLVKQYKDKIAASQTVLLDTRKTLPGLRIAQKYAVACAGGQPHRLGLFDAYLIKENHFSNASELQQLVTTARERHPERLLEVEVESLSEFDVVSELQVDRILCDNFSLSDLQQAVDKRPTHITIEASGGITLDNIASVAATGVDFISVGALTKDVKSIDYTLLMSE